MSAPSVTLIFTRRRAIGSALLRAVLWSRWSHCGIVVPGGDVVEASVHGVVQRPLEAMMAEHDQFELVTIPCPDPWAVIRAAQSQIGTPYDWLGLLGFGFRSRRWQDDGRWFCSELIAYAFAAAGYALLRYDAWRVSPPMLYLPIFRGMPATPSKPSSVAGHGVRSPSCSRTNARGLRAPPWRRASNPSSKQLRCKPPADTWAGVPVAGARDSMSAMDLPEDNPRQFNNLMQRGRVAEIDHARQRCRVAVGEMLSDWVEWFTAHAGGVIDWDPPGKGEEVLLLCPAGDMQGAVALRGFYSSANPAPSSNPDVWMRQFPDGARLEYNHATHALVGALPSGATVKLTADAGFEFNGPFKVNGDSQFKGDMAVSKTVTAETDVVGGGKSLKGHKHLGVQTGAGVTGLPQ